MLNRIRILQLLNYKYNHLFYRYVRHCNSGNNDYLMELNKYQSNKSPKMHNFSWVVKNAEYVQLLQKYFSSAVDTFKLFGHVPETLNTSPIDIVPIHYTPFNKPAFLNEIPRESVSIGGPSALVMAYFESKRYSQQFSFLKPPLFATQSVYHTNAYGSALQIHQRYAQRMAYTSARYEGWYLLKIAIERLWRKPTLTEAQILDYLTVDFDWNEILQNDFISIAKICIKNELITWQDKYNRQWGRKTSGYQTYRYAMESARILEAIDQELGGIFTQQGALSIGLSEQEANSIANKNLWLQQSYGIESLPLTIEQLKNEFNLSPAFYPKGAAFYYPKDGYLNYDFWHKLEKGILKNHGHVEKWRLKKIVLTESCDKVVGLIVEDAQGLRFIRTNKVYSSLGYSARYQFINNRNINSIFDPSVETITTATGFSGFALIKDRDLKAPIAFNSHHTTKIAEAEDKTHGKLTLVKTTGGALLGADTQYHTHHAINNIWYNQKIFGNNFKLVAAKACPRSINSSNSGKFTVFPGLVIGTGRGGKGVTDMGADAMIAGEQLRPNEPPYLPHSIPTHRLIDKRSGFFCPQKTPHIDQELRNFHPHKNQNKN